MTKRKPDQVIEYRVSLQDKQSEQLDTIIAAFAFNKVGSPLVALLSDPSAMLIIVGFLEATGIIDLDKGVMRDISNGLYENYGDAMKAFLIDPILPVAFNPLDPGGSAPIRIAEAAGPAITKGWIWLMTTGRVLIAQKE